MSKDRQGSREPRTYFFRVSRIRPLALRRAVILATLPLMLAGAVLLVAVQIPFALVRSCAGTVKSAVEQWRGAA